MAFGGSGVLRGRSPQVFGLARSCRPVGFPPRPLRPLRFNVLALCGLLSLLIRSV